MGMLIKVPACLIVLAVISQKTYCINSWLFAKLTLGWNGELPLPVPHFDIFLTLSKFK